MQGFLAGDRDLELRRKRADDAARAGADAAKKAFASGSLELRSHALREVSRALAFDPSKPQLLSAYGQWTKKSGFYELKDGQLTELVYEDAAYGFPQKATKAGLMSSARTLVLALVLGGIIAGLAAYVRATRKPTFFRANEPELVLGAPLLADVPARSS